MSRDIRFAIHGGGYIAKNQAAAIATTHGATHAAVAGRRGSASELATLAKLNCPVSKVLNAEITLDAELV